MTFLLCSILPHILVKMIWQTSHIILMLCTFKQMDAYCKQLQMKNINSLVYQCWWCIKLLCIRIFWAPKTCVKIITDAMSRDRYFLLRDNLKVVDDSSVPQQPRTVDRLWKLWLFLDKLKYVCLTIPRQRDFCIHEHIFILYLQLFV